MEEEIITKEKPKKKMYINIITIGIIVVAWISIVILRLMSDFSVKVAVWILAIITILAPIALFFGKIANIIKSKTKNEDKTPEPASDEEIMEILKIAADKMMNHIKKSGGLQFPRTKTINHNQIYAFKVRLLHREAFGDQCWMVLNANYPKRQVSIIPLKKEWSLDKVMNEKAEDPKDSPDTEVTTTENPILGTSSTTVKKTHNKKEKEDKKKETLL